jgi:hypothetical protein
VDGAVIWPRAPAMLSRRALLAAAMLLAAVAVSADDGAGTPGCPVKYAPPMFGFFAPGPARPLLFGGLRDRQCAREGKVCARDGYW